MERAANIFACQNASHTHILFASPRECHAHYHRIAAKPQGFPQTHLICGRIEVLIPRFTVRKYSRR
jgi:hypothetical protein